MPKVVSKWQAVDGTIHNTEEAAYIHERDVALNRLIKQEVDDFYQDYVVKSAGWQRDDVRAFMRKFILLRFNDLQAIFDTYKPKRYKPPLPKIVKSISETLEDNIRKDESRELHAKD